MMHPMTMSVYTENLWLRYGDLSSNELTECRPCNRNLWNWVWNSVGYPHIAISMFVEMVMCGYPLLESLGLKWESLFSMIWINVRKWLESLTGWCYPLWKIWVRQLGLWNSQYMESHNPAMFQSPPTSWESICSLGVPYFQTNPVARVAFCKKDSCVASLEWALWWLMDVDGNHWNYPLVNIQKAMENHHFQG